MKRILVVGLIAASLAAGFAVPAFAHCGAGNVTETTPSDGERWQQMYESCINGDWEGMLEAMDDVHGGNFDGMPCYRTGSDSDAGETSQGSWHMGGGTMHGGWGGMMGW